MAIQISQEQIKNDAINANKLDLTDNYTFTGTLAASTPSADSDVAIKSYVDSKLAGLSWKAAVEAATTGNITLSGEQTVDGVSLSTGNRILVKDQTDAEDNGIYVVDSGAWSRADDMDAGSEFPAAAVFVKAGTTNEDLGFVCTNDSAPTLGTDAIEFTQFNGAANITAGDGLTKSGNDLSVNVDNSSLEISSDALQVATGGITNDMLAGSIATSKLASSTISGVSLGSNLNSLSAGNGLSMTSYNGSAAVSDLTISLNGSTLFVDGSGLKINSAGVSATELASNAVVAAKIASDAVETAKIKDAAVTSAKMAFIPTYEKVGTGDGTDVNFDAASVADSNYLAGTLVFRNGLAMELVESSPSGQDQYSLSADGGTGGVMRITFGSAPNNGDVITALYFTTDIL